MLDREYLSSREAAKVLGVSTATLRKMVKTGALRAEHTPGGHLRFAIDSLAHASAMNISLAASGTPQETQEPQPQQAPQEDDKKIA
jgi:excisionase family DNA binding protein